jgi:outer membrane protein insertion porin family
MMRAVSFALLLLLREPATQINASVLHSTVGSSLGVIRQQEQPASYRVAKVTVEGADAFSAAQIINLSRLKAGQAAGEQTPTQAREAIQRAYVNRGRIKAIVRIRPDFKSPLQGAKQGIVDVSIEIDEGAVFVLRRLEFIGNETTRDRIVRRRVLQQEGEPYSQELMERSLNRINGLRRFRRLTMADVESRVDEKEHFVDLLVHLKEIKRSQTRR